MKLSCGPACFSCDMLSIEKRCPMDREIIGPDVWSPGDLDKVFRKLSSEPYKSKYDVKVLSSPDNIDRGPWVLTMENFVGEDEANRLIELGSVEGYERSTDVGEMQPDGNTDNVVSKDRTSWNAWCSNECIEDKVVEAVSSRISNMTEIPILNSEDLQLLRYGPGQLYVTHHDYIEYEIDRQGGVRIITVYLYL
jgi:prolyl 4-hydroxylase